MSKDISPILEGWDHEPDELQVRLIAGDDGREKLQMRIELGLLQMELQGRPDGTRPFGHESLLDYYESEAAEAGAAYRIDSDACAELMREGVQYYHRYLALFHLDRFDLVARDTARNLRLFAFVRKYAARAKDKLQFDQYRPYVTMMRTRALGMIALERNDVPSALERIDDGIQAIRDFLGEYDQLDESEKCRELTFLHGWRKEVEGRRKLGPIERLEEQLALAVSREDFEEAARLRDQIRRLQQMPSTPAAGNPDALA